MAISGKRIILANNQALRAKDQNGDVQELLKLDGSGQIAGKVKEYIDAQNGIDQGEITQLQSDVVSLDGRLDIVEPKVSTLETNILTKASAAALAQELIDRAAGDTATLDAAKAYADSIKPVVSIAQTKHVAKDGVDGTADGSISKPYATISAALASITDASPSKRYAIKVAPGSYTEASVALKSNVFIIGEQKETVRISGPVSMGAWTQDNAGSDDRSGFSMVTLLGAANFDWSVAKSRAGKLYMNEVIFGSTLNLYGYDNAIAQAQFDSCVIFGAVTISGINVGVFSNNVCYQNVTLNQHPGGGMATILSAVGGYCGGTVRHTTTVSDFNRRCASFLRGFASENLIIDGPSSYADVDLNSQGKSSTQKLNGGQLVALSPRISHDLETQMLKPLANNAHNLGDWGKQFMFDFAYVHASSGSDLYLSSLDSSYDPAGSSAGYSVNIESDGYGLKPNVNGGDISLKTGAVSGTGVRGKIKLDAKEVDVSSVKIVNLADGSSAQDAVTKSQLDTGLAGKASTGSVTALEGRVGTAEGQISTLQTQVAGKAAQVDLSALAGRVTTAEGEIDTLQSDLDAAELLIATKLDASLKGAPSGVAELDATGKVPVAQLPTIQTVAAVKLGPITLSAAQVSNGYVDLSHLAMASSISVFCERMAIIENLDYTVSVVGGVSRLTWIGPSASGAEEEFIAGDVIYIQYLRQA